MFAHVSDVVCRAMGKKAGGKKEEKQTRHGQNLPMSQCMLQVLYPPLGGNLCLDQNEQRQVAMGRETPRTQEPCR